jgi:glutaredoxin
VKELLSRGGHAFTVKNVEEDSHAYTELVRSGYRTVPVTLIGTHAVRGFDEARLREALAAAGS